MALDQFLVGRVGIEDAVVATEPQHDDPVGDGADVLHVVADHRRRRGPRSRTRSIRLSTSAVCATPRAAVGSSSRISFGVEQQRPGDRNRLPLATGKRRDRLAHARDARRKFAEQRPGPDFHRRLRRAR